MSSNDSDSDLRKEFKALVDSPRRTPPEAITKAVRKQVQEHLEPPARKVFLKLVLIHLFSGSLTLLVCEQFGVGFHELSRSVTGFLQRFGDYGCMFACGAFFLGLTGIAAALLLRREEMRSIRKTRILQIGLLSLLSLGTFLAVTEQERHLSFGLILTWLIGSVSGGSVALYFADGIRAKLGHSRTGG